MLVTENENPSADQSVRDSRITTKRFRSLANIGRVLWECQCDGFRSDSAVEDLGLIREPTDSELVWVDNPGERNFEGSHARLVVWKMETSLE